MKRILVAGIGNIFFGDDAFGCEVARRFAERPLPPGVRVQDFGIRSYDLAYALMDCDAAILIDAVPRHETPGTLFLIEPDVSALAVAEEAIDAHSMNPVRVLQMVRSLGGTLPECFLVGCEPAILESNDGAIGISNAVRDSIPDALSMIDSLIQNLLQEPAAALLETART